MGTPDSSRQVYYQLDTLQGPWQLATGSAPSYSASLQNPAPGTHVIYAFAVDGSHVDAAQVDSPVIGPVATAVFTVVDNTPPPPTPAGSATSPLLAPVVLPPPPVVVPPLPPILGL